MSRNQLVEDYWIRYYAKDHCTLCGNRGVIDTRGVRTNAGLPTGRLNWCICPNGQIYRGSLGSDATERMLDIVRGVRPGPVLDPMKRFDPMMAGMCTRQGAGHAPCNGWAREDCVHLRCAHGCWPGRSTCMCKASVGQACCFSSSSSLARAERAFAAIQDTTQWYVGVDCGSEDYTVVHLQRDPLPALMELTEGPLQPEVRYYMGWPGESQQRRFGKPRECACDGKGGSCKCWDCVHGVVLPASKGPGSADR